MSLDERIEALGSMLQKANYVVFLGGAGVSTESGIPDFRSKAGQFERLKKLKVPAEVALSRDYFVSNTADFFEFYRKDMVVPGAEPNAAHYTLAKLERDGKLKAIITQNIDGLHQKAGSKTVYELHGSVYRAYCLGCSMPYNLDYLRNYEGPVPSCEICGGVVRPDVVLYGEPLPEGMIEKAAEHVSKADVFIAGGTSLVVYPAAGLVRYARQGATVIINRADTPYDSRASLRFRENIGEVLSRAYPRDIQYAQ